EGLVDDLALHERQVELAPFQQRHVLDAAPGIARLDVERRLLRAHDSGQGLAIDRKAAAGRGRAEREDGAVRRANGPAEPDAEGGQRDDEDREEARHRPYPSTSRVGLNAFWPNEAGRRSSRGQKSPAKRAPSPTESACL